MTARRVSCVVADDHPILLHAIQSVLEGHGIHVTGTATSGQGAIELIRSTSPTVALVDLRLEGADGIEVARILRRENVATRIILFTGIGNGRHLAEALALGVQGFIQKDAPVDELLRAIEMVCAGTPYIDPTMGREIAAQAAGQARVLTARESDVLRMVAAGQTTGGIADRLGVSEDAAQGSIQTVMRKLGATTRSQAVALAIRQALIP
jgi:DNA-binding NarL/FixJ family response regulator